MSNVVIRVANVRHRHMILTIRNTHIFSKQPSTQVKKLICESRIHYIAKNGTAQLPSLVSSFICMFHHRKINTGHTRLF